MNANSQCQASNQVELLASVLAVEARKLPQATAIPAAHRLAQTLETLDGPVRQQPADTPTLPTAQRA